MGDVKKRKLAVFIGKSRPFSPQDTGYLLIEYLSKAGFNIAGVFLYEEDPLLEMASDEYPCFTLPPFLAASFSKMKRELKDGNIPDDFAKWLTWFKEQSYEEGLVFYSNWIPPHIFNLFPRGMYNYHPGPLPELPGYEPETMAVLLGIDVFYGTLHTVNEKFDDGEIVWYSPAIKVKKTDGPVRVLYHTTRKAIEVLPAALEATFNGTIKKPEIAGRSRVVYASRKACRAFAVIDWQRDGNATILRKNRAFNEQEISLFLMANITGEIHVVLDAVNGNSLFRRLFTFRGRLPKAKFPGIIYGTYLGPGRFYRCPVIRTLTGRIIIKMLPTQESANIARIKSVRQSRTKVPAQLEKTISI